MQIRLAEILTKNIVFVIFCEYAYKFCLRKSMYPMKYTSDVDSFHYPAHDSGLKSMVGTIILMMSLQFIYFFKICLTINFMWR
jgi:hypothetical protein